MRIAPSKQAVVVRMPLVDLGCLCFLPDVQRLMARFPRHIKVNLVSPPYLLALNRQVIPFVLATTGDAPALHKLRHSLRAVLEQHPQGQ